MLMRALQHVRTDNSTARMCVCVCVSGNSPWLTCARDMMARQRIGTDAARTLNISLTDGFPFSFFCFSAPALPSLCPSLLPLVPPLAIAPFEPAAGAAAGAAAAAVAAAVAAPFCCADADTGVGVDAKTDALVVGEVVRDEEAAACDARRATKSSSSDESDDMSDDNKLS